MLYTVNVLFIIHRHLTLCISTFLTPGSGFLNTLFCSSVVMEECKGNNHSLNEQAEYGDWSQDGFTIAHKRVLSVPK